MYESIGEKTPEIADMSDRADKLFERHQVTLTRYLEDATGNYLKALYFRQPSEIDDSEEHADIIKTIKDKEIELTEEESNVVLFYYNLSKVKVNELSQNKDIQRSLHLIGMFENVSLQLQNHAQEVVVTTLNLGGSRLEVIATVPSRYEDYCILEAACKNLVLDTFNTPDDEEGLSHWVKAPSLISLHWLQKYFNNLTDGKPNKFGSYL